jgi:hypothetical protein
MEIKQRKRWDSGKNAGQIYKYISFSSGWYYDGNRSVKANAFLTSYLIRITIIFPELIFKINCQLKMDENSLSLPKSPEIKELRQSLKKP